MHEGFTVDPYNDGWQWAPSDWFLSYSLQIFVSSTSTFPLKSLFCKISSWLPWTATWFHFLSVECFPSANLINLQINCYLSLICTLILFSWCFLTWLSFEAKRKKEKQATCEKGLHLMSHWWWYKCSAYVTSSVLREILQMRDLFLDTQKKKVYLSTLWSCSYYSYESTLLFSLYTLRIQICKF